MSSWVSGGGSLLSATAGGSSSLHSILAGDAYAELAAHVLDETSYVRMFDANNNDYLS